MITSNRANRPRGRRCVLYLTYLVTDYDRESRRSELALQDFSQSLPEARRRWRHLDPGGLHGRDLGLGIALAARDDGPGVPHSASGRRGAAGNKTDHRLFTAALGLGRLRFFGVDENGNAVL